MMPRKFNPADVGLTEEQYQAMDEQRRRHFRNRAQYLRDKEAKKVYAREYSKKRKEEKRNAAQ